jgi:hypothetical protein
MGGVSVTSHKAGLYYDDVRRPAEAGSASRDSSSSPLVKGGGYINITATITRLDGQWPALQSVVFLFAILFM